MWFNYSSNYKKETLYFEDTLYFDLFFIYCIYRIITMFTKDQSELSVKFNQAFEKNIVLNFSVEVGDVAVEIV